MHLQFKHKIVSFIVCVARALTIGRLFAGKAVVRRCIKIPCDHKFHTKATLIGVFVPVDAFIFCLSDPEINI